MIQWLLTMIGVGEDIRAHLAQAALAVQHPLVFWIGLALLAPAGWFIYQRQRRNLGGASPRLRIALTATRIIVLAILVIVLSAPYLRLDRAIEKRPILAYVLDGSQSMALPAGPFAGESELAATAAALGYPAVEAKVRDALGHITRAKLAHDALDARRRQLIEPLAEKYDLRFYRIAERLDRLPVAGPSWKLPEVEPSGTSTRLGDGIAALIEEAAGREIAGIVLLSDGQNNAGLSPAEAARAAAEVSAPIFTVPCGSEAPVRDLAVADVFAPDLVSVGDTVHVSATVELQGYAEAPVEVQLTEEGGAAPLASKELTLRSTEPQTVDLSFEAKQPGLRTLTVKVAAKSNLPEDLPENNTDSVLVRVSDEKLRVLYAEGAPRWQFRFLKNAMRRDHGLSGIAGQGPDIVLETEVRRLPAGAMPALPKTLDELAKYHTIILGDVSPQLADSRFVAMLAEGVRNRGVGLIVASGPLAMPGRFDSRLTDLLPVRLGRAAAGIEAPVYKPFRLELSPDGAVHDTLRLYDDRDRNEVAWSHMPPFYWCAAVERPAAGATVLAWNPSLATRYGKMPLVAHHYAGRGKVLFVGTDSTWLWRQNVGDRFFYKFWGQAIRFVAAHDETELKKKGWLDVRPLRPQPGEQVDVELFAPAVDENPRREPKLPLHVRAGEQDRTVELTADPRNAGRYTGRFRADAAGSYRLNFDPGRDGKPIEAQIRVANATTELRRPNINVPVLRQLGKLIPLDQLATIPKQLQGEVKRIDVHREASIWDNWLVLTLLVIVYCVDIGLRRMAGLS
jgi:hypothetical protein